MNTKSLTVRAVFCITTLFISLTLLMSQFAYAQFDLTQEEFDALTPEEQAELIQSPILPNVESNTPGAVNCFDYYTFGSIQVDVAPYFSEVHTTDSMQFAGNLINENPYPVVDGQIWMKVFRMNETDEDLVKENGYPMVDFVLIEDNVVLKANEDKVLDFEWEVPEYAAEGEYMSAFFFTTAHRYNLLGLSFTDDVTGNTVTFNVKNSEAYTPVVFDKNSVHVNDTPTSFALPPRHFGAKEPTVAYATLVNDSDDDRVVEVSWHTYKWDGILEDFKRDTQDMNIVVPANTSKEIGVTIPILDTPVTYVLAEVKDEDSKSLLNIRFVRDGIEETRINFPGMMSYPLQAGEENTLFSCVHSTNLPVVSGNTLTLTLKDGRGNQLHQYKYEGDITGAMMGLADSYTPDKTYGTFALTAELSRNGQVIEEVTTTYDCSALDSDLCEEDVLVGEDDAGKSSLTSSNYMMMSLAALIVVVLVVIGQQLFVRRKIESDSVDGGYDDLLDGSDNQ